MRVLFALLLLCWAAQADAANRFWIGGTGTWDSSTTTHWSATSGGAGGQSVPGSADTVTFDGSSGGGTVTVNTTVTVQSITCGAFTGTLDFSANNNNVTLTASTTAFDCSGTGTRTINLGNGTWTLSGTGATPWNLAVVTNLTFNANSSTIVLSGTTAATRNFASGSRTYSTVSFSANSSGGIYKFTGGPTIATLNMTAPLAFNFVDGATTNVTNALNLTGASGSAFFLSSDALGTTATISSANNGSISWAGIRDLAFTGGGTFTASSSFNLGNNSGITITAPTTGGGFVIGGL